MYYDIIIHILWLILSWFRMHVGQIGNYQYSMIPQLTKNYCVHTLWFIEDNPAVDLDTGELVEIAASVGTPVSAFLMQDEITNIIPDGVTIPPGEPYGSAAAMLAVSMTILLMSAVAALFFNWNLGHTHVWHSDYLAVSACSVAKIYDPAHHNYACMLYTNILEKDVIVDSTH